MMKSLTDAYRLSNGVEIPCVGFGTWQTPDGAVAEESVRYAIEVGYRHIDTAAVYGNEVGVGAGIHASGVDRKELFVTSKLPNSTRGYDETIQTFQQTLSDLKLDYLDLYLIHWPNPKRFRDHWQRANADTWRAFETLYEAGKIRAIGISNFMPHHIDALMETAKVAPMVNQIRLCPGETQDAASKRSLELNMLLEAYSPLGMGSVFEVPEMIEYAKKYNKSIAQICLRWSLQMGYLPLPKSVTKSRIVENAQLFDFELSDEDVKIIAGLTDCCGSTKLPDPDQTNF